MVRWDEIGMGCLRLRRVIVRVILGVELSVGEESEGVDGTGWGDVKVKGTYGTDSVSREC